MKKETEHLDRRKFLIGLIASATVAGTAITGCGGGHSPSDTLLTLQPGMTWVYSLTGSVTLPDKSGQQLQTSGQLKSTLTMSVASGTSKDANNQTVSILDRKLDLFLLDGREIKADYRLYFSQSNLGIFVHGANDFMGDTFSAANDHFVPGTVSPPFKFLYLPNPLLDGSSLSYTNPFGLNTTGDVSYSLQIGTGRTPVQTPAGTFLAKGMSLKENFNTFTLTNAGIVPDTGIVVGTLDATLPDTTVVSANMALIKVTF